MMVRIRARRISRLVIFTILAAFSMGVGIAYAAGIGDTCGSASTPPSHPNNWYSECNDLAAACARDVQGGYLQCTDSDLSGACVGGICAVE